MNNLVLVIWDFFLQIGELHEGKQNKTHGGGQKQF
jgi:hypothetical protein